MMTVQEFLRDWSFYLLGLIIGGGLIYWIRAGVMGSEQANNLAWMIQDSNNKLFLGVCKKDLVTISNASACFKFADMDSASVFLYWLIQTGVVKEGHFKVVFTAIRRGK